ncbi:MAG: hypothetical protein HLX45_12320 [Bacillus sp. (in: Bacteria)]|jgi:hypothetical protein|nr:hypothetical protein [Bacillus sp. (in: firmicutes)]
MELEIKKEHFAKIKFQKIAGFLSFLIGLISLAGMNAYLLLEADVLPDFFFNQLPMVGIILGIIGLFTRKSTRLYAWWGLGLNIFIYVFIFLMIVFAWSINAKP